MLPSASAARVRLTTVWRPGQVATSAGRPMERIEISDLHHLADIAADVEADLSARHPAGSGRYAGRLLCRALCQGAALHFVDHTSGVKDFDVWSFYAERVDGPCPARWRGTADFGPSANHLRSCREVLTRWALGFWSALRGLRRVRGAAGSWGGLWRLPESRAGPCWCVPSSAITVRGGMWMCSVGALGWPQARPEGRVIRGSGTKAVALGQRGAAAAARIVCRDRGAGRCRRHSGLRSEPADPPAEIQLLFAMLRQLLADGGGRMVS